MMPVRSVIINERGRRGEGEQGREGREEGRRRGGRGRPNEPLTTLLHPIMALSTTSGPQTRSAPYSRERRRWKSEREGRGVESANDAVSSREGREEGVENRAHVWEVATSNHRSQNSLVPVVNRSLGPLGSGRSDLRESAGAGDGLIVERKRRREGGGGRS